MRRIGLFLAALLLAACANPEAIDDDASGVGGATGRGGTTGAAGAAGTAGSLGTAGAAATGGAGTGGVAGVAGTTGAGGGDAAGTTGARGGGAAGTFGTAGRGGAGTTGSGGTSAAGTTGEGGRGGATGIAGTTGAAGVTGGAGRGGTTGAAGGAGTTGSGGRGGEGMGGRAGAGGAGRGGANAGGAGGGGAGGSTGCNVNPVNANASAQARKLLCYIYSLYGKNVLSGQQETSWSNPANDISWYVSNVGKSPAILGGDYLYPNGTSTRAIAYWQAGGITMIRYHMGAPGNSDTYENSMLAVNVTNVLTNGTSENNSFKSKLDYVATELHKLEDANVAVLWAPFHEYQPNGWFWWSKGTATQFIQLWQYMYDYLTTTKSLNNVVWLAPSSGSPNASWYPGKSYVDLAGPDTYGTNPPFTSMYSSARNIIGTTVPITLHETGVVPQPATMFPSAAPWVLWNIWAGYQISENTVANIQSAYASTYTITRDEVPNLK